MLEEQWVRGFEAEVAAQYTRLGPEGAPILIAVSGGPDSVCLAAATVSSAGLGAAGRRRVAVATVDHRLRKESAAEVRLVGRLARIWRVEHLVAAAPTGHGPGLEARARTARYAALERLRQRWSQAAVIATAHTQDDQAETVLMRLGRGASLRGAAGVLPRRGVVVRPLLFASRAEVRRYLRLRGLPCVADAMNDELRFARVAVRRLVLPALAQALGGGVVRALARFADHAREDDGLLQAAAEHAWRRLQRGAGLERVGLCALERPIARRVVAAWLERAGASVDAEAVEGALRCARTSATQPLPGDLVAAVEDGVLTCAPAPPRSPR